MSLECETCPVRDSAACAALTEEQRANLARRGHSRRLSRGETLFRAGEDPDACATLISGTLKVAAIDTDGVENILALVHPAGFIGEMFVPFTRHDVIAAADSQVCLFSRNDLEDTVRRHPELGVALLRRSQEDLHAARDLLDFSRRRSAQARVAGFMLSLAHSASNSPCHPAQRFELPLTRGEIASLLGVTIETVSRQIGKLETIGALRRAGARRIELVDPALLSRLAA